MVKHRGMAKVDLQELRMWEAEIPLLRQSQQGEPKFIERSVNWVPKPYSISEILQ